MLLSNAIRFQKTLALSASASNPFEAEAAELAARRLIAMLGIDPMIIPNASLYNRMNFANNELLLKLREEWRKEHPPAPRPTPPAKRTNDKPPAERTNDKLFPQEETSHIPFSFTEYRKQAAIDDRRKSPHKHSNNVKVTPTMLLKIHAMIDEGIAPALIRDEFGLTKGQIAGIKGRYDQQHSRHQQATPTPAGNASDRSPG